MNTTKRVYTNKDANETTAICITLGHATRLQIQAFLLAKNNLTFGGDRYAVFPLVQSTVTKHILELQKIDLIHAGNIRKKPS